MNSKAKDQNIIDEILTRGVAEVVDRANLMRRLKSGERLRIKLGIDPTSPNVHLGRAVPLLKLRDFQELGHTIVLIIGDFTGVIGDTSDKAAERPMLSRGTVEANLKTYIDQYKKIIDIGKAEIRHNSEWLSGLSYREVCEQANVFSLAEFIARKNIRDRLDEGKRISLRELLYPLMQGYDSVMVHADIELGGTDQRFNLLAGRVLQEHYGQKPQDIMTMNLIMGTDGRKMSSSWGNTINLLDEPKEMFGKVMSMRDEEIISYFIHCTRVPMEEVREMEQHLEEKSANPRDVKMMLAREITKIYWGEKGAEEGEEFFKNVFQHKEIPDDVKEVELDGSRNILNVLVVSGLSSSTSAGRRLIDQGAVRINGEIVTSYDTEVPPESTLQKGKKEFRRIV